MFVIFILNSMNSILFFNRNITGDEKIIVYNNVAQWSENPKSWPKYEGVIFLKLGSQEFLRSLITILNSDYENSKWRIQYGGQIFQSFNFSETRYLGVLKFADYGTEFRFLKSQMADPIWWTNSRKGHSIFSVLSMNMFAVLYKNSINLQIRSYTQLILSRFVEKRISNTMQVFIAQNTTE